MARPTKQGIDYFPLDTEFDDDLQLFITEMGAEGLGILLTIWQSVYKSYGYYINHDANFPLKIKQKCFSSVENIINVVGKAIDFEIFDVNMYENYHILTSRGIQKRYFIAARGKKQIEIIPEYILIDVSNVGNVVNVVGNGVVNGRNATKEEEEEEVKEEEEEEVKIEKKKKTNYCPQKKIVALYHKILPELTTHHLWDGVRADNLRARQKEKHVSGEFNSSQIEYWEGLFQFIRESDFLMGKRPPTKGHRPFTASLDWIVKKANFLKIVEGNYSDGNK